MSTTDKLTDEQWLIQHLEDDAEACSAVNGSKDITTKDARRAEVTVKRLIRERDDARRASQAAPAPKDNDAIWAAFYRDGLTLEQLAEKFGLTIYDLSPWLYRPLMRMPDPAPAPSAHAISKEWAERMLPLDEGVTPSAGAPADGLREALEWYADTVRKCRMIHSEGDQARAALDADGGQRARAALAKIAQEE